MQQALEDKIARAAEVLRKYGATGVFLFGSATRDDVDEPRDIDMAVEGLPARMFFDAYAEAGNCLDRELDLVRLEENTPFTRYLKRKDRLRRVD
ncbi:MAG: nucleotidyltransferase domain-containing protein [Phycisphaerae bacterium]|nr:nucleotidyltransferase domain-containing protein [Phycisphaerae bacterium]